MPHVIRDLSLIDIIRLYENGQLSIDDISNTLLPDLAKVNSIAIDIESDGREIYQLGYATACETKLFNSTKDGFFTEIKQTEATATAKTHWLIGHNIVAWDLPVLRGVRNNCFSNKIIWDTLLLSWILSPWEKTHALVNKEKAHRADSDARASLALFWKQINQLPTEYVLKLVGEVFDPIEYLFRNPDVLYYTGIDRDYPDVPHYFKDNKKDQIIIIPQCRLGECAWCRDIVYVWPENHIDEKDCLIDLAALERILTDDNDIWLKALTVVVRDAEKNNVQVLLGMIPLWLRNKIIGKLSEGKCLVNNHSTISNHINVSTYYAHRGVEDQNLMQVLSSATSRCLFLEEGQFDLRSDPVALDNHNVTDIRGFSTPHAGASFYVNEENNLHSFLYQKRLITKKELNTKTIWITYDPANRRIDSASCWHIQKQICLHLSQDTEEDNYDSFIDQNKPVAIFPSWTAMPNGKSRFFNDFVPPTSDNRVQYWVDALWRLLSLENNEKFNGIYILLVSHLHEKDIITTALCDYDVTIPFEGSPLRHLERLRRNNKHFAVDTIECANQWLTASETMNCEIQLVVESLPIEEWWICLNSATEINCSETFDETYDESEEAEDDDSDVSQNIEIERLNIAKQKDKKQNAQITPVILTQDAVQSCIGRFLKPWLSKVTHGQVPSNSPIILDCRFDRFNFSKSAHFARHDFVMTPFAPPRKEWLLNCLREAMGDIARENAPTDYDTYRKFFAKHWSDKDRKIEDFKPETQRPAIEAIIPNDSDVLVRLPTGEGKSVLFQVPALVRGLKTQKLTIVVTPLRALMADQVRSLWSMGFFQSVDYLSGDRDPWINSEVYQGIIDNRIKLLYIAPERFRIPRFREALSRRLENDQSFEYVVIDEAHCISQWGFEFRPDYLYAIRELRKLCRTKESFSRFLFFSATVTDATLNAILEEAGITEGDDFKIKPETMPHPIQPFIRLHSEDVQSELYGAAITSSRRGFIEKKILDTDLRKSALIIFVTRKRHARGLCDLLDQSIQDGTLPDHTRIRYFHADIPSLERQEIYEAYKKGEVNVLICTKAFGMGMDISHIHKCIHLAPPTYLEDYLQEVGRTGRGAKERREAGLAFVDCDLLYDKSDFDTNNRKIMDGRIRIPALESLWNNLTSETKKFAHGNENLCVIPENKYANLDKNMLRLSLFWLERMDRLEIIGSINGLLKVRLNKENLQALAKGNENVNLVADALLKLYEPPAEQQGIFHQQSQGMFDRISSFISTFLGVLFGSQNKTVQTTPQEETNIHKEDEWADAEIHLENIWQRTNLPRIDDVLTSLRELQSKKVLYIVRIIEFEKRFFFDHRASMLTLLNLALSRLIAETPTVGRSIKPIEMFSWFDYEFENAENNLGKKLGKKKIKSAVQRVIQSAIALCSAINIRIFERYDVDGELTYTYTLNKNRIYYARKQAQGIFNIAKDISDRVDKTQSINFTDLLSCCGSRVDQKKLMAALRLLTNLGICSNKQNLLSQSYILGLKTTASLNHDDLTEHERETLDVLDKCNEMSRLRSHAMDLYARLETEHRKKYIDDYFKITNPQDMERFLANTVDEVGSDNQELQEILSSVRGVAMKEELEELHPEKRPICERRYQDKFLVNAGPGAGKTRVLMMRCAHLIHHQGLAPDDILVLAFNRAVVYEIRERIIELFTKLRYGSYVKKMHVYTFHAFAKRAMQANNICDKGYEDDLTNLLHSFAEKLKTDEQFRNEVGGRYKTILIDEFQDMNDDFYDVIISLQRASNAGLMVIGDDDQDILLWNRLQKQRLRLHSVDYFEKLRCDVTNNKTENLVFNFRSCQEIVDRSQKYLNEITENNSAIERLKTDILLKANPENKKEAIVQDKTSLEDFIKIIPGELVADKEIAILCRTNAEVFDVYKRVMEVAGINRSDIKIQNNNDLRLSDIREFAEWLDICRGRIVHNSDELITDDLYNALMADYSNLNLPHVNSHLISQLWAITNLQFRNPNLQNHIEFIEDLYQSDYERLRNRSDTHSPRGRLVISTIHKVKGLEFDTVFINPSSASFPLGEHGEMPMNCSINHYAAEEARLFYVAMTRAKSDLYFQLGERERKWYGVEKYSGGKGQPYLEGKHEEVFLSWPGFTPQFEQGMQYYIKKKVSVDDRISIENRAIIHGNMKIGLLAGDVDTRTWNECVVRAIIRSPVDEKLKLKYERIYDQIAPFLKEQGWLYTVLVQST